MADVEETLGRAPVFSEVKPRDLKRLAKRMGERSFGEGDTITTEGESGVGFFVIEEGNATVSRQAAAACRPGSSGPSSRSTRRSPGRCSRT